MRTSASLHIEIKVGNINVSPPPSTPRLYLPPWPVPEGEAGGRDGTVVILIILRRKRNGSVESFSSTENFRLWITGLLLQL